MVYSATCPTAPKFLDKNDNRFNASDPHCVFYEEHGSRNHPGGLKDLRVENKSVPCFTVTENVSKCLVFILNLYMKRLPSYAFIEDFRPKEKCPADPESPWYEERPLGKNALSNMMKEMSQEGGIAKKTNHSLCATGASAMFQGGVAEKITQKATGHKSVEALRTYEQASSEQFKYVSKVLMGKLPDSQKENAHTTLQQSNASTTCSRILGISLTALLVT